MQDFDTLRHRVEETAVRLSSAQSERQDETQSLIGILRDLEEKYSAQEKQFTYYKNRLEPLEQSNAELTTLIENLLDLIDRGFGESSLDPLRKASEMASKMLENELVPLDDLSTDSSGNFGNETVIDTVADEGDDLDELASVSEPEMATFDDIENVISEPVAEAGVENQEDNNGSNSVADLEEDAQVIQDLMDLVEDSEENSEFEEEAQFNGVSDLELEEVPLTNLEKDIEVAAENMDADQDAIVASVLSEYTANAGEVVQDDRFEDVSDAVLELELQEDAHGGFDDLPEIVKSAVTAFETSDTSEEARTLEALARAMEQEVSSGSASTSAPSDIRSLMLRVEALAKKAEEMRIAQGTESENAESSDRGTDSEDDKKSGVAA